MVNPFDFKTALLAKHAQHVVLIHFPIALFVVRLYRAMDKAPRSRGRGLLQPAGGGDFNISGARDRTARMAAPTRGTPTEGHLMDASRTRVHLKRADLACVVDAFPRSTRNRRLAELPPAD